MKMRLDKFLAKTVGISRSQCKHLLKNGVVTVNNIVIKKPEASIDTDTDVVHYMGKKVCYEPFLYLMMNKPSGYVSATCDKKEKTVIELLPPEYQKKELFIAGRLDKDTEGLLILTNDGVFAHNMLSPKKHVPKTYYAKINGLVTAEDIVCFQKGIVLEDNQICNPAQLVISHSGEESEIFLTITQGMFHQVKRMFQAVGKKVIYLKRVKIGELSLDESLSYGQVRKLNKKELNEIGAQTGTR